MIATTDPGPFSSLFNYEDEQKRLENRKNQLMKAQQRIARTNAVGDAFRLIIDAIGGSMGATITPKPVNPAILQSTEKLYGLDTEHWDRLENFRLSDLAAKEKDLQYNLGLEAEGRKVAREEKERTETQTFQKELENIKAENAMKLEKARSANDLLEIYEKSRADIEKLQAKSVADVGKAGGFYVARYDDPNQTEPLNRDVVIGMFKDLKEYLAGKGIMFSMLPKVLQTENKGNISNDDLRRLIADYPDFFAQRFPQLTGGVPLPAQPELTPIEKRRERYNEELERIMINLNYSPRERERRIRALQRKNKDIMEMIPGQPARTISPAVFKNGEQDFTEFLRQYQQNQ